MVLGTGIASVDVARVDALLERWGERFERWAFSDAERAYCGRKRRRAECYAARWAAKRAALIALAIEPARRRHRDVEVGREPKGRPLLRLSGEAARAAGDLGVRIGHLSLSHDAGLAVALVVLEG